MILPTQHPRDFALDDGRSVRIRPLRAADCAIYEAAVYSLSPRSRYLRFFAPIEKMSKRLLDQMTQVDGHRHVAWLALTPDESTGVGVVRYARAADDDQFDAHADFFDELDGAAEVSVADAGTIVGHPRRATLAAPRLLPLADEGKQASQPRHLRRAGKRLLTRPALLAAGHGYESRCLRRGIWPWSCDEPPHTWRCDASLSTTGGERRTRRRGSGFCDRAGGRRCGRESLCADEDIPGLDARDLELF
jgi:hypothetical protein